MKKNFIVIISVWFLVTKCDRDEHAIIDQPHFTIFIYYKNNKGENLLDPVTTGHYNTTDIKINGGGKGWSDFSIDSTRYNSTLPKGFALSFSPSNAGNKIGMDIITLNNKTTDTLSSKYSGPTLVSCSYNRVNVLPTNLTSPSFPVVIIK